jgi:hypothetical protein
MKSSQNPQGNAPEYRMDNSISRIIVETKGIWKWAPPHFAFF